MLSLYPAHDGTLASLLESRAAADPRRVFLVFGDRSTTWGEFRGAVEQIAVALSRHGVASGDRVAAMAENSEHYVTLFFALARLGAILVPINPAFGVEEARYVLHHAEVSAICCARKALDVARQAAAGLAPAPWFALLDEAAGQDIPHLSDLASQSPTQPLESLQPVTSESTCLILYTSGTTGFPKGVMHSQGNFVLAGEGFVERMHLQPDERLLCVLPLFHINALFYSLGGAAAAGATLVLAPHFSASQFWTLAAATGATEVNLIAAVGNILARRPRDEFVSAHRLTKIYGAPIPPDLYSVFRDEFGVPTLIEGYGMTEIPGACNLPFEGPEVQGSMGRPARHPDPSVAFAELRVADEAGLELPPGEVGELLVRTPILMKGYYRDPEQTAAAFRVDDAGTRWFATGDLVRRDENEFYTFVARQKDIIRKRGENIAGAEIDRVIAGHPAVAEVATIGVPSELGEEDILVAVVARADRTLTAHEIVDWCDEHLATIKRPRYVTFLEALPLTPTHRVAKFKLKADPTVLERAVDLESEGLR